MMPRALRTLAWRSSVATTVIGAAPTSPRRSTSHPAFSYTARRAARSAAVCAVVDPVTKATAVSLGRRKSSVIRSDGGHGGRPRALVPGGREPVTRGRDGEGSAEHEAEIAWPRGGDGGRRAHAVEERYHLAGRGSRDRQRFLKGRKAAERRLVRGDAPIVELVEISDCAPRDIGEKLGHLARMLSHRVPFLGSLP